MDELMEGMAQITAFAEGLSGTVSGAITRVRDAPGMKSGEQAPSECPGCGVSLAGLRGEVVRCPCCGTCVIL